ncbi:hypothetical protein OV207_16275 [Corallococcus sp. BB11-1]|uniref:hypothetical protein n=1 Tax=Corallococcus sp. BB11-1 TaxID=2996783 RepID=UPI00226FC1A1|nr:hypothetical protein [Corallococcus sp. BB11-1]MCY1033029.1 hypothetical protein [Corallococcus sp. BB11-1]
MTAPSSLSVCVGSPRGFSRETSRLGMKMKPLRDGFLGTCFRAMLLRLSLLSAGA